MKAVFTLVPSEARRLIAKAVVAMAEVQTAKEKGYLILGAGTTNGYIAQELLDTKEVEPQKFTAGTSSHRLLCVTDAGKRYRPFRSFSTRGQVYQDLARCAE